MLSESILPAEAEKLTCIKDVLSPYSSGEFPIAKLSSYRFPYNGFKALPWLHFSQSNQESAKLVGAEKYSGEKADGWYMKLTCVSQNCMDGQIGMAISNSRSQEKGQLTYWQGG